MITKIGKWLGAGVLAIVALSACAEKDEKVADYSGQYEMLAGSDCELSDAIGTEALLEIVATSEGETSRSYRVQLPMAVQAGFRSLSTQTSPNEGGALTVFFGQEEDGMMGYKSAMTMGVTLVPHASKPDHLWITRWDVSMQNNLGVSEQQDILEKTLTMMKTEVAPTVAQSIDFTNQALCLGKISRFSEAERSAQREAAQARLDKIYADETERLKTLPFSEFWLLRGTCRSAMSTPTCRAHAALENGRIQAEREREIARLAALSETAFAGEGKGCKGTTEPRCYAYFQVRDERRAVKQGEAEDRFLAMRYSAFVKTRGKACSHKWSEECVAYTGLEKQKRQEEVARIIEEKDGQSVFDMEYAACNSNSPTYDRNNLEACYLARDAAQGKRGDQAVHYRNNPVELRETYNACFDEYHALKNARKSDALRALQASFRCRTARDGAQVTGHSGEFRYKMDA